MTLRRDLEGIQRSRPRSSGSRLHNRLRSFAALAAALLVGATILSASFVLTSRPVIVGQLTESTNCKWGASSPGIGVGTLLQRGQDLDLIEGKATITFASGARVFLEGPTSLRLDSSKSIHFAGGYIAAKVPRPAVGFTVTSSLARFVDLGTAFTLSLRAEMSFELYVFEGLVELQLDKRFGEAAHHPVRVAQIHAMSFDVGSGDVKRLEFETGKEMPF